MSKVTTNKKWIASLAEICAAKGVKNVFLSPGSRCAPLVIAFNRQGDINCKSITDERSAAFVALGFAQENKTPCALVCTSGSALLNYAPALAEAYYSNTPLIVLSADRPNELIDQADGQALKQKEVYTNYIKGSFELPNQLNDAADFNYSDRIVNEAINTALAEPQGPVHINIPLKEPLYDLDEYTKLKPKIIELSKSHSQIDSEEMTQLKEIWQKSTAKMILLTNNHKGGDLSKSIGSLANDASTIVLSEYLSNEHSENFISNIDPVVDIIENESKADYSPEILITFGGAILSKKLKVFLRKNPPKHHWHIQEGSTKAIDTYFALTKQLNTKASLFFEELASALSNSESEFQNKWKAAAEKGNKRHHEMLEAAPWSDLKVFGQLMKEIPENGIIHLANSTPVRYAALFPNLESKNWKFYSNRGVSGIDGSISTALGQSLGNKDFCTVITGDLSFLYDSNALFNLHVPSNFRIIIINNQGGNIFRIINGPSKLDELETYFETKHNFKAEHIAKAFDLTYYFCDQEAQLQNTLPEFYKDKNDKAALLEISTPNIESADWLKKYLKINNQL